MKDVEDNKRDLDEEELLLNALLKLSIMKKAVTIHMREMESNTMVDLKV
jgi:hypothetical protein